MSRRDYDEAVSDDEIGAAAVKQAQARLTEARLNLGYTSVTAPVNGYASRALKSEGSLVTPGHDSLLTTVSQVDPMYVNFGVSEAEQLRLNSDRHRQRRAPPSEKDVQDGHGLGAPVRRQHLYPQTGKLDFVDPRVNPQTGSFDARAEMPESRPRAAPRTVRACRAGESDAAGRDRRAATRGDGQPAGQVRLRAGKSQDGKDVALPRPVTVGDWVEFDGQNAVDRRVGP